MVVFYCFHVFRILEIHHQFMLYPFNYLLLVLQLLLQVAFLPVILLLVLRQLSNLHLRL